MSKITTNVDISGVFKHSLGTFWELDAKIYHKKLLKGAYKSADFMLLFCV